MIDWNAVFPISLKAKYVSLIPLCMDHAKDLREAVVDGPLTDLWYTNIPSSDEMETEITRRLGLEKTNKMVPFSVLELSRMKIDILNLVIMIGYSNLKQKVLKVLKLMAGNIRHYIQSYGARDLLVQPIVRWLSQVLISLTQQEKYILRLGLI